MKKSAIAVAVAAVLAAPVALADVSISGQLQTQIVSVGGDDGAGAKKGLWVSDGGMGGSADSGNWGALNFVASEDLGDGMKALAKYSMNVKTANGIGTREAYVGLAGGFGAVLAGRLNHPYKTSTVSWDPFLATFMQARNNVGMANFLYGSEIDNALAYAGTFGAVKVVAAMVIDETTKAAPDDAKTNGKNIVSFSVNAPVGPVELAVAYVDASEYGNVQDLSGTTFLGTAIPAGALGKDARATKVGAKWAAGDITVAGQYEMLDKGLTATGEKSNVMYVTGSYKMGNNTISASYGRQDKKVTGGTDDATYLAIGLNHAMSKNTSAFVGYRSSKWDKDLTENAVGAGLRVKF